jgi:Mg2+/Co2+ transporter CorC
VTIEDILEEIVGEITDEYDREEPGVEQVGDGTFRVRSTMHVDELGELFGRDLDDEDVDTVGGLLSKALGRVPIPGSTAVVSGLELVAERPAGRRHRIATVLVRQVADHVPDDGPDRSAEAGRTSGSATVGESGAAGGTR